MGMRHMLFGAGQSPKLTMEQLEVVRKLLVKHIEVELGIVVDLVDHIEVELGIVVDQLEDNLEKLGLMAGCQRCCLEFTS